MTSFSELKQRNVLVTGGANGIGASIARAFHQAGARIFFCDTDRVAGQALAKELRDQVFFSRVDLLDETAIRRWIQSIGARWRQIHVLVNNAASDPRIPLEKTRADDWDRLFARNLRAYFLTSREALKWMRPGAAIINLASITFHIAPTHMTAYVATKGGVLGFTRSLAREVGPRRIRVNAVSPGWVMTKRQLHDYVTAATKRLIRRSQCVPDLIQPEEIASVVLFLASNASRAITGQEILVDRGWAPS